MQQTSIAQLLRMEDRRELDTALVRRLLSDPLNEIRGRAALAAGRIGDRTAGQMLRQALLDRDTEVKANAAFALGELGDTASGNVSVLRDLMLQKSAVNIGAAREAAHALGKLVSPASYAALHSALASAAANRVRGVVSTDRPAPTVVSEILLAIWHHPRQPGTASAVAPFLTSKDNTTRFAATYAIVRGGARPAMVPALLRALRDADPLIRATGARGLRFAITDSAQLADSARNALVAALADASPQVRINAVTVLGGYRQPRLVQSIASLLPDSDGNVATAAATALGALRDPGAAVVLNAVVQDESSPLSVRGAALVGMAGIPATGSIPHGTAQRWLTAPGWMQRVYAVRALALLQRDLVAADLRGAVRDPDPRVQAEALGAIAAADTSDTTHSLDALYLESLASADPIVRSAAITALGRHRDAMYLSALMDAYARAQSDRENDAVLAAVDALATLARTDSAVARSFFFRFPRSHDPVVRATVARRFVSGNTWGAPTPSADRPLPWYEDIVRTLVAPILNGAPRPRASIRSASGDIQVELAADDAPLTVFNFMTLANSGYFNGKDAQWHRVVPNFVLQDGDPRGDGNGGPGYSIRDEINRLRYTRGALGMALSGPDTGGSQFFVTHSPQPHLDGGYTVFGYVTSGMSVADRVVQNEPIRGIDIIR